MSSCGSWIRVSDAPAAGAIQDGEYLVGQQVSAGEYRASVPQGSTCYWATLTGFTGSLDEIIANVIVTSGAVVADIPPTAAGFESSGCGTWTRIG